MMSYKFLWLCLMTFQFASLQSVTMPLDWLFGHRKTPEEMLRQNQRALNKAMRDLDRERNKLEGDEKKVINNIKKMAKEGQMVSYFCQSQKQSKQLYLLDIYYICYTCTHGTCYIMQIVSSKRRFIIAEFLYFLVNIRNIG